MVVLYYPCFYGEIFFNFDTSSWSRLYPEGTVPFEIGVSLGLATQRMPTIVLLVSAPGLCVCFQFICCVWMNANMFKPLNFILNHVLGLGPLTCLLYTIWMGLWLLRTLSWLAPRFEVTPDLPSCWLLNSAASYYACCSAIPKTPTDSPHADVGSMHSLQWLVNHRFLFHQHFLSKVFIHL